jgi:DNA (cytosine-5)-methyltransferase 1
MSRRWPTPKKADAGTSRIHQRGNLTLLGAVIGIRESDALRLRRKGFPTPTASMLTIQDQEQARTAGNGVLRKPYAESFPTPKRSDGTGGAFKDREKLLARRGRDLKEVIPGGPLNPTWVEWLMGWPTEWSALKPLGTDRSRSFTQWLSENCVRFQALTHSDGR